MTFLLPDQQAWDVIQERHRHDEALYRLGEAALFTVLWTLRDFEAGLVTRCSVCYLPYGETADVYSQVAQDRCTACFGTSFEGGIKAQLVRPSLWQWTEETLDQDRRGEIETQQGQCSTTSDFRCQPHDFIFRSDGQRYRILSVDGTHLSTGFGPQSHTSTAIEFNYGIARTNPSDPAYLLPPSVDVLQSRLGALYQRWPQDFSDLEQVNGPTTF